MESSRGGQRCAPGQNRKARAGIVHPTTTGTLEQRTAAGRGDKIDDEHSEPEPDANKKYLRDGESIPFQEF